MDDKTQLLLLHQDLLENLGERVAKLEERANGKVKQTEASAEKDLSGVWGKGEAR